MKQIKKVEMKKLLDTFHLVFFEGLLKTNKSCILLFEERLNETKQESWNEKTT